MDRVDIAELKAHLEAYLEKVEAGQDFVVCKGNQVIARLVPGHLLSAVIDRPATRPASEFWNVEPVLPTVPVDVVALLRESRDQR